MRVEGRGALFEAVVEAAGGRQGPGLSPWRWRTAPPPAAGEPVLSVYDHPDAGRDRRLHRRFAERGLNWLAVRGGLGEVWIGPRAGGGPGCPTCLELRRRAAHRHGGARQRIDRLAAGQARSSPVRYGRRVAALVLDLAQAWADLELAGPGHPALRLVLQLPLPDAGPRPGWLAPVPGCPACGGPPSAGCGRELGGAGLRAAVEADRPAPDVAALLVDARLGVVCEARSLADDTTGPAAEAYVASQDALAERRRREEWGLGRADTPRDARAIAVLEALERYCCMPRGRVLERAPASDLEGAWLDPRRLVLHDDEQYARAGFPFEPFDAGVARDWTWAYSLGHGEHLAVPADLVFYRRRWATRRPGHPRPLAYNTSSGCAIGGTPAQAALHALLELLERDAFLLAWYGRASPAQLDLDAAEDLRIPVLRAQLAALGYEVFVFDVTPADIRVPCVWALAVSRGAGLRTLSGAACHPDPERAVFRALREVAGSLGPMRDLFERRRQDARRLLDDPSLLRRPADHVLLYGLPEAFDGLRHVFQGVRSALPVREHFRAAGAAVATTPERWAPAVHSAVLDAGLDVLIADMTASDLRAMGLVAVRALVPGTLPLTFGAGSERLAGAARLLARPARPPPHPLG
jgi:ribosomal protein S12 methylthiotransferase accessory factor